jgi:hypothetical protein
MKLNIFACALILTVSTLNAMEEPDNQEENATDQMKYTIFDQMETYNTSTLDKTVIQGEKFVMLANNTDEIPRLRAFFNLKHGKYLEKNYYRNLQNIKIERLEFNIDKIDEFGKTYYGQTTKQKVVWFIGGVAATVGFMKLCSYFWPKSSK